MAIVKLKDVKVGDDYDVVVDSVKAFENYKEIYRMSCEFEHIGGTDFKVIKGTPVIYAYGNKVAIYPLDGLICRAHILTSVNFEKKFIEKGVRFIEHEEELVDGSFRKTGQFGSSGEFILDFHMEDLHLVADIFKIKKAPKTSVNPYSMRNLHEHLRFMRNIDKKYGELLEKRLEESKEEEAVPKQQNLDF